MVRESFKFGEALKGGYSFLAHNFAYTAKVSIIPFALHIICNLFVQLERPSASVFEIYLWQLPAVAAFGWLLFLQVRLMFFMERFDTPITHPVFIAERIQAKQASVIIFILFNMFFKFSAMGLFALSKSDLITSSNILGFMPLVILLVMLWSVRFGVLYIIAAVSFPLGIFVKKAKSPLFSVQLVALAIIATMPIMILFQMLLPLLVPSVFAVEDISLISDIERIRLVILTAPVTLFSSLIVNACVTSAIKQMLFLKRV